MLYGLDDTLAPIPLSVRNKLKTCVVFKEMMSCKHEPFNDYKTIQHNYKNTLLGVIDKQVPLKTITHSLP